MGDWTDLADVLQKVRVAEENFLGRWAVEEAVILPVLDRVAADLIDSNRRLAELNDGYLGDNLT